MRVVNDPRPWWGMIRGEPLSIVDLIDGGTLSDGAAAVLSLALERGASTLVAGIRVRRTQDGLVRRLSQIGLLHGVADGVSVQQIGRWDEVAERMVEAPTAAGLVGLAQWAGVPAERAAAAIAARAQELAA